MNSLQHFLNMGGYAVYVWSAYGCTAVLLGAQWFVPWRRWRKYLKGLPHHE